MSDYTDPKSPSARYRRSRRSNGVIRAASEFAPATVELVRLGKVPPNNSAVAVEAVCESFLALRPSDLNGELDRHERSTDAELVDKGVALALFERAQPPSAGEFRRFQNAGLNRVALARAVEAGRGDATPPAWFIKRKQAGHVTSVTAESDTLVTIWAVRGVLPEAVRGAFDADLAGRAERPNSTDRKAVIGIAAAVTR